MLAFPLSVAAFAGTLRVADYSFDIGEALEMSEGGNGQVDTADYGPRLWSGEIVLSKLHYGPAEAVRSILTALTQAGRKFHMCDPVLTGPQADPAGAALGSAEPTVLSVDASRRALALQGLPAGYDLTAGDKLTIVSSGGQVSLHRLTSDVSANGIGNTATFEVVPNIRTVVATDDAVTLIRPYCLAMIRPGSVRRGSPSGVFVRGIGFEFVERLQ